MNYYLNQLGLSCALGSDPTEVRQNLQALTAPGFRAAEPYPDRITGQVLGPLPAIGHLPQTLRSRNNQLLLAALAQIRPAVDAALALYGPARIGVVLGTSTSGIGSAEHSRLDPQQGFDYQQIELGSPAQLLQWALGLQGPAYCISTACSSSSKALASAARLLQLNLVDVVLTGGVDSLCQFTLAGFNALDSLSATECRPFGVDRDGINIGEGAALFLMSRESAAVRLSGWGETSDAYHMSAPDPSGQGALAAMQQALARAGLRAEALDYLNLHGTGTPQNDAMESLAVSQLQVPELLCSSTKNLTGHCLGAAGAIEAALCWLCLQPDNPQGWLPAQRQPYPLDPQLPRLNFVQPGQLLGRRPQAVLSNSFAFGGNNAALILQAD